MYIINYINMIHINCLSYIYIYKFEITTICVINALSDHVQIVPSAVCGNKFISLDIHTTLFV